MRRPDAVGVVGVQGCDSAWNVTTYQRARPKERDCRDGDKSRLPRFNLGSGPLRERPGFSNMHRELKQSMKLEDLQANAAFQQFKNGQCNTVTEFGN